MIRNSFIVTVGSFLCDCTLSIGEVSLSSLGIYTTCANFILLSMALRCQLSPTVPEPTFAATRRIRTKKLHLYLFLLCIVQLIFCCAFCSLDLSLNILRLHCCKIVTTLEVDTLYVNYISMLQFEIPAVVDYAMCIILFTFRSYNSLDLYNKIVYLSRT